jgi:hypothetical protein
VRGKDYSAGLRGVLFEAKHHRQMGQAIWLFGWLVLRQTRERDGIGFVLGGRPVNYREIEEETGFARKSLERWMKILRRFGYIETTPGPGGIIVRIQKAKKFLGRTGPKDRKRVLNEAQEPVQKLWKTSAKLPPPLLNSEDTLPKIEEAPPHSCGRLATKVEKDSRLQRGISSGEVERQIELQSEIHPAHRSFAVENFSATLPAEHFPGLRKEKNADSDSGLESIAVSLQKWHSKETRCSPMPCDQGEAGSKREPGISAAREPQ